MSMNCSARPRRRASLAALASLATCATLSTSGCLFGFEGYDGVFFEAQDVSLDLPGADERAAYDGPHFWVTVTADEVNGWVTDVVETSAQVVSILNNYPETDTEGEWRVYGPFDDDAGRDLAWLVRIAGDGEETSFEIEVGPRGASKADTELAVSGTLRVDGDERSGELLLDFDVLETHDDWKRDPTYTYAGDIAITFTRNVESEAKTIDLDFMGFEVEHESFLDDDIFTSDEAYSYTREADGAGTFHLALMGEWDSYGYSGPLRERMQLDEAWDAAGNSRTVGEITDPEGTGDLTHGDLYLEECHDPTDSLVYREINDAYLVIVPDYNQGDAAACVVPPL